MVCLQQTNQSNKFDSDMICEIIDDSDCPEAPHESVKSNKEITLLGLKSEPLEFQHIAGGNIVEYPPIYAPYGNYLLLRDDLYIHVYNTTSGEKVRSLSNGESKIISMEFEPNDQETLITCSEDGIMYFWEWSTGTLKSTVKISLPNPGKILTFNLLYIYENSQTACAFVIQKTETDRINRFLINTTNGRYIQIALDLSLRTESNEKPMVATSNKTFHFLVIVLDYCVYFVDYKTWKWRKLKSAHGLKITALAVHPTEACIATGDVNGQVFIWRDFFNYHFSQQTSLYHWHHTPVTSIAFSSSGTSFYSSGQEAVLVRWNIGRPDIRNFLPRLNSITLHIVVNHDTSEVALCTADNGIQFLNSDTEIKSTLQEFTYAVDDKTGLFRFPVGLQWNPRSNTLVLNGRVGHLQFFSVYSKTLLYNMNIVNQNALSREKDKILYDIRITRAAFNIDWMATGEVFNDQQHIPELRLKFWKFDETKQCYELNTNIEMPHEHGFRDIRFSNSYQVDNLLCATVGEDNIIRVWALRETENIYRLGSVAWGCVAQTSYHNMPIQSICFSIDGSVMAAGFGNTLCVYVADSLKLKVALSCPSGFDGSAQKVRVHLPNEQQIKDNPIDLSSQTQKEFLKNFSSFLENRDPSNISKLTEILGNLEIESKAAVNIKGKEKVELFKKIVKLNSLSAIQKLQILQKLQIPCDFEPTVKDKITEQIKKKLQAESFLNDYEKVHASIYRLDIKNRFKAKYRLKQHFRHLLAYDAEVTQKFENILKIVGLDDSTQDKNQKINKNANEELSEQTKEKNYRLLIDDLPAPAHITHVQFGSGENAHIVIVCTNSRVIVWNLLTLRSEFHLKIATKHLAYDSATNLVAIISQTNELSIFEPHMPLPVYKRSDMPDVIGLSWMPRRNPKSSSIYIDWQSQSILYFLTSDQKIKRLSTASDKDDEYVPAISMKPSAELQYTTFGTYATQKYSDKSENLQRSHGPLVFGNSAKEAVQMLTQMSCHTMPPMSMLCGDIIRALAQPADDEDEEASSSSKELSNGDSPSNDKDSDSEPEESDGKLAIRKSLLSQNEKLKQKKDSKGEKSITDEELNEFLDIFSNVDIKF